MKSTTSHEDQFACAPTPQEEEAWRELERRQNAAPVAAQETRTALDRYRASGAEVEEKDPLERLRFFCSLAMSGQDWLDVEPFFDAVAAQAQPEGEAMAALSALVNALRERHHGRMPDEVQAAYDRAWAIVFGGERAQQPVSGADGLQELADSVVIANATGNPDLYHDAVMALVAGVRENRQPQPSGSRADEPKDGTYLRALWVLSGGHFERDDDEAIARATIPYQALLTLLRGFQPQPSGNAGELERECADLAHQLNQSNERNGLLREALQECSAELFAQCGDQKRAMRYVERARAALAAAKEQS